MSTQKVLRKLSLTEKASAATTTTATTLFQIKRPKPINCIHSEISHTHTINMHMHTISGASYTFLENAIPTNQHV